MKESSQYIKFRSEIQKLYPDAWVYKIPDTFGIGGRRPFDIICIIKGLPFAVELKVRTNKATVYQQYQLDNFEKSGGFQITWNVEKLGMSSLISTIQSIVMNERG